VTLLAIPAPYDFDISTERFRAFGVDLANLWNEGGLHRVVGGREVRIEPTPGGVDVTPFDDEIRAEVEVLLGLPFDLHAFYAWVPGTPVLAAIAARLQGFRPPLAPDAFEALVTSITAQQVSLFSAFAMRSRMIERFGERAEVAYAFPTRERLADATEDELFAVGFSRRKAEYVIGLARSELDLDALANLGDDEIRTRITSLRGLGPWTAEWFLARHLARPRAWPVGDIALQKAVRVLYGSTVEATGPRLDPFQNLSAHYLLTGLRTAAP
jgi:DNA-3-methyladenine glycosylase II